MPIESLVSVVFYRGLTTQVAVERDTKGRSNYSMITFNPRRISNTFNEQVLQYVVDNIAEETKWLLEVVNYNVINQQYVCAGDVSFLPICFHPYHLPTCLVTRPRLPYQRAQLSQGAEN